MASAAFISFRLGVTDGVSVVARNWQRAFEQLGYRVHTVAGDGPVDRTVPGLAIAATDPPTTHEVREAIGDVDVVVVENLCTIPLNLPAARVVAEVLAGRPAILHHHDPPWQRPQWSHVTELPPRDPAWRHVTINQLTRREMESRGYRATCIYNGFPVTTGPSDRAGVRRRLGVDDDAILLAHPVRAIARKNIPAAVRLAEQLGGTYWLWGPAEDGYDDDLARILRAAKCPVVRGTSGESAIDLYGAADAVLFPSTWEGFGNPPVEAAIHRVPCAVGPYPVADELRELGLEWYPVDDPEPLREAIARPDEARLEHNRRVAVERLSLDVMRDEIAALLAEPGWLTGPQVSRTVGGVVVDDDPILIQRAKALRIARSGQRLGFLLYALAVVVFFIGMATDFTDTVSAVATFGVIAGSVVLAPAILAGYAVKAAVRDDLEHGRDIG